MTLWKPAHRPLPRLMYRLKKNVHIKKRDTSGPALIQYTPLRVMEISRTFQPLMDGLNPDEFIPFTQLAACVRQVDSERTADLLNTLTREGFVLQRGIPETDVTPKVSVIISAVDHPRDIPACLRSLALLLYPEEQVELILITKDPETVPDVDINGMLKQWPQVIRITGESENLPAGRNRAARAATGEILAFINVECVTNPLWLKELMPAFQEPSLGAVGGMIDSYYEIGEIDQYMKFKFELDMAAGNRWSGKGGHFVRVPACNFLIRRSVFLELNGFREDIPGGEEVDFCRRIQESDYILEYKPAGRVSMRPRKRIMPFFTDCYQQGMMEPMLQRIHPEHTKHLFAPPAAILFWLLLAAAMITGIPLFMAGCLAVPLVDTIRQNIEIRRTHHLFLNPFLLMNSVLREYVSLLYYTCTFISRHYLFFMFPLLLIFPFGGALFFLIHLIAGMGSYWRIVPLMGQISFMFFFTFEQLFYQAGLWRECIRSKDFKALVPRMVYGK